MGSNWRANLRVRMLKAISRFRSRDERQFSFSQYSDDEPRYHRDLVAG
jgi:hypothetical protein